MAEECSVYELEGFKNELERLLSRYSSDELQRDSKTFCSDFCKLVEGYTCRWQVPLPQIRVLQIALCYFVQASSFFTSTCDHVHYTLSSVALSVFELLLFFDQNDFQRDPLKLFSDTFQECHLSLARHQNVHMLQITHVVQCEGPWGNTTLQAILSDAHLPQSQVDKYISSELPVFFELRVHYLLSCKRVSEAVALAKCCARHPTAGQHLFFLQVYLTWLCKTSQHEHLHKAVTDLSGKDAVHIICSIETKEEDEVLLALSKAFLSQQLCRGDMYYLWDLVFVWSKLHWRVNPSKRTLLEESHQLMLSATNVQSIFPFIRVVLAELGEEGLQFCVELCANALRSCLACDVATKSLIYKTIANLLPNDLEVCRACALLVFFLERTVEAYKMVFLLYTHPDQEYPSEASPIGNHVRFEILQILKKGLYFDPEFWNLITLRTNCLKLMSEKVLNAALEEIMEEEWIPNYCTKESALRFNTYPASCQQGTRGAKKRHQKEDGTHVAGKRVRMRSGKAQANAEHVAKRKGKQGPQTTKETSSESFRRSFWQPEENFTQQFGYGECRRITRLSEQKPKRKIRKPRWLLEDSGALENNVPPKVRKHRMKPQHQRQHRSSMVRGSVSGAVKNNGKHTTSMNSHLMARENETKCRKEHSIDSDLRSASPTEIILELSQPDNEVMGTFNEDNSSRPRGHTQTLLYRPTVKPLVPPQPVKAVHRNEVILRARDASLFVQQLHCYTRRQKGKGVVSNMQVSFSTITRSSVQGSPPKVPPGILCEKPVVEMKVTFASQAPTVSKVTQSPVKDVVSQTPTTAKISQVPTEDRVSESTSPATVSQNPNTAKISQPPDANILQITTSAKVSLLPNEDETSNAPAKVEMTPQSQGVVTSKAAPITDKSLSDGCVQQTCKSLSSVSEDDKSPTDTSIAYTTVVMTKEPMDSDVPNVTEGFENIICSVPESTLCEVSAVDSEHVPSTDEVKEDPVDIDAETNAGEEVVSAETTVTSGKTSEAEAEATHVPKEIVEEDVQAPPTQPVIGPTPALITEDLKVPLIKDGTSMGVTRVRDGTSREPTPVLENMSTAPRKAMPRSSPSTGQDASAMPVLRGKRRVETMPREASCPREDTPGTAVMTPQDTVDTLQKSGCSRNTAVTAPENHEPVGTPQEPGYTQNRAVSAPEKHEPVGTPQEPGYTQNRAVTAPENRGPGGAPQESEESKLKYCCTICNKLFRGKCVIAHAMFHYSRDECMFCGTLFKNNLLAMMHLSEHIEKLKKSDAKREESPGSRNKPPDNRVSESQEKCSNQTSAKTITLSSPPSRRGRPRKSVVNSKPVNTPESSPRDDKRKLRSNPLESSPCDDNRKLRSNPPESSPRDDNRKLRSNSSESSRSNPPESSPPDDNRRLRSNSTPVENQILHENRLNASQPCCSKTPVLKVNGHIGRRHLSLEKARQGTLNIEEKHVTKRVEEISYPASASDGAEQISLAKTSALQGVSTMTPIRGNKTGKTKPEESPLPKAVAKEEQPATIENTVETQENVCCPVDGCVWNADLSKSRISLLYHALEDHHGDIKPLELSFRVSNSRCGVCMRVLWSFQHYQDHVVRHRLTPRHPCLHQGCDARFRTGNEMRRHTRKHSPLQAPCCLPGCSKLFICLWALNLHEREHYAATPTKTKVVKKTHEAQDVWEQEGCEPTGSASDVTVNKSAKAAEKSRGKQMVDNLSIGRDTEATPLVTAATRLVKKRLKEKYNLKDSNGMNNVSVPPVKDSSPPAATIIDRLRQMLRTKTAKTKHLSVPTAALAVANDNTRNRLNNTEDNGTVQVPRKRGRPLGSTKLKKIMANRKAAPRDEPVVLKEEADRSGGSPSPLTPSPLEKTQASVVSNDINTMENDTRQRCGNVPDTSSTAELIDESKTPIRKHVKCVEETDAVDHPPEPPVKAASRLTETSLPPSSTAEKTLKLTEGRKSKKSHVSKKLRVSRDKGTPATPKVKEEVEATKMPESNKAKRGRPRKDAGLSKPSGKAGETLTKVQLVAEDKEEVRSRVGDMGKANPVDETIDSIIGSPAPSGASKAKDKEKAINALEKQKVVKKGRPIKNPGVLKSSGKPAKSKTPEKDQPVIESHGANVKKEKTTEGTLDSAVGSPTPSNSSKVNKSLKATHIPGNKKVVKKVCPSTNPGGKPAMSETPAKVQPVSEDGKVQERNVADMGKEKPTQETLDCTVGSPAPLGSTKLKKKRKATNTLENKAVKKVCRSKNTGLSKPARKPGKSKIPAEVQPVTEDKQESQVGDIVKTKPVCDIVKTKPVEEALDSTVGSPAPSNPTTLKMETVTNTLEEETVEKVSSSTETGLSKPLETPANVQESHVGDVGKAKPVEIKLNATAGSPGYSLLMNGHVMANNVPQKDNVTAGVTAGVAAGVAAEKAKAMLAATSPAYGKRPFVRPPPTAYLDERYTNMPKRRKEVSMFNHSTSQRWPAEQVVAAMPLQRQRCANCFISFGSTEELQTHLSLKKCSNLFGFDSDDESNF